MAEKADPGAGADSETQDGKDDPSEGWCYIDEEMVLQGPFSDEDIDLWIKSGLLAPELLIMHTSDKKFKRLESVFDLNQGVEDLKDEDGADELGEEEKEQLETEKAELEKVKWVYRDDSGALQGPFDFIEMYSWHVWEYLPKDLHVRKINELQFVKLEDRDEFPKYKEILAKLKYSTKPEVENPEEDEEIEEIEDDNIVNVHYQIIDGEGKKQGPFSIEQVGGWLLYESIPKYSLLSKITTLSDGTVDSTSFKKAEEYEKLQQFLRKAVKPNVPNEAQDYTQSGKFNLKTGRFQRFSRKEQLNRMGLEVDKSDREISTYIDLGSYQKDLRDGTKKRRPVKNVNWSKVKEERKKRRLLREYKKE